MPEIHPFVPANHTGKWYRNNCLHLGVPQPRVDWFVNADSFAFMPSKDARSLFLGTFPTFEVVNQLRTGGNTEFFYGQRGNNFWSLIELLSGQPTATEINQFQLLQQTSFGLTDILKKTDRDGTNSGDKHLLRPWVFNDMMNLKSHYQHIENIYCTSGGMGKVTAGSSVNAARWLLNSLQNAGYNVTGFNLRGYNKHIKVYSGTRIVWTFELYNLFSPSDMPNGHFRTQIRQDTNLQSLISKLPTPFTSQDETIKLRIAQWSYLLSKGGFPLVSSLQSYVTMNNAKFAAKFS